MNKLFVLCLALTLAAIHCKNLGNDLYYQMKGYTKKEHPLGNFFSKNSFHSICFE